MKHHLLTTKTIIAIGLLTARCYFDPIVFAETKDSLDPFVNDKVQIKPTAYSAVFQRHGDGIRTCPVTGEKVTKKSLKADYFGRTDYFCCSGCLKAAQANPEKFLKLSEKEQLSAVKAHLASANPNVSGEDYCNE